MRIATGPQKQDVSHFLRRRSSLPVWADLVWRLGLILTLIAIVLLVHWMHRAGLRDTLDGHISFIDVLYFTTVTVTTVGYGDIVPISPQARLFETFVVTPIRLFVWLIFLGTAYSFFLRKSVYRWRMARIQKALQDHIVVCGFGVSGSEAVREMIERGANPEEIVVIDGSEDRLASAEALGCNVMGGDATRDSTLSDAQIGRARSVLVSAGRDDTSILITLTVRHLSPEVPISIVVRNEDNEMLARQAGATTVINPVSFTGLLLAGSDHGPHIAEYIADLAASAGRVHLNERAVAPEEVGKPLSAISTGLGVRVYREDTVIGFYDEAAQSLQTGDTIIEIVHNGHKEKAH
ncbi:MAG: potassium channel family protein [Sphingobium sp.]|nr:potassium channel family protein [Sphingobium sp.]